MNYRFEFHDSSIERIEKIDNNISIHFESMIVLEITDEFGFEFDKTHYVPGKIIIQDAEYEHLPVAGEILSGYIGFKEWFCELVPVNLKLKGSVVLFIEQVSLNSKIFGSAIAVEIDPIKPQTA